MASYKYQQYLQQNQSEEFDREHTPGTVVGNSGIYRCSGCGDEIAANKGNPLPPQNHHQHSDARIPIRWKLLVFAVQI
jgi:hypothetical protein